MAWAPWIAAIALLILFPPLRRIVAGLVLIVVILQWLADLANPWSNTD